MWVVLADLADDSDGALGDPEPVEATGGTEQVGERPLQLRLGRALGQQGLDVLEGAPELVEAILQAVEFGAGHEDDVIRKTGLRRRGPLLVGTLATGLAAVETRPADGALLRQDPAAPAAPARLCSLGLDGNGALRHRRSRVFRCDDGGERVLGSHASGR